MPESQVKASAWEMLMSFTLIMYWLQSLRCLVFNVTKQPDLESVFYKVKQETKTPKNRTIITPNNKIISKICWDWMLPFWNKGQKEKRCVFNKLLIILNGISAISYRIKRLKSSQRSAMSLSPNWERSKAGFHKAAYPVHDDIWIINHTWTFLNFCSHNHLLF